MAVHKVYRAEGEYVVRCGGEEMIVYGGEDRCGGCGTALDWSHPELPEIKVITHAGMEVSATVPGVIKFKKYTGVFKDKKVRGYWKITGSATHQFRGTYAHESVYGTTMRSFQQTDIYYKLEARAYEFPLYIKLRRLATLGEKYSSIFGWMEGAILVWESANPKIVAEVDAKELERMCAGKLEGD